MLKRIHVNRHNVAFNKKAGRTVKPPFSVKTYKSNHTAFRVSFNGPTTLVSSPGKALSCGATVWIETQGIVTLMNADNKLEVL